MLRPQSLGFRTSSYRDRGEEEQVEEAGWLRQDGDHGVVPRGRGQWKSGLLRPFGNEGKYR